MAIITPEELKKIILAKRGSVVGLDLGTKTIGVAVGDLSLNLISPLVTIKRTNLSHDLQALQKIVKDYKGIAIILGLPLSMDGTEGKRCQASRQFAHDFLEKIEIHLCFWDERLTTVAALESMQNMSLSPQKQKQAVNHIAASYILKSAFEGLGLSR